MKKDYFTGMFSLEINFFKKTTLKSVSFLLYFCLQGIIFTACGPFMDTRQNIQYDLSPPVFKELKVKSENTIILFFNEPASIPESSVSIIPELTLKEICSEGNTVLITVSDQVPGHEYSFTATCEDEHGNSLHFIALFHGYNSRIPGIIINEFTTQGSSTHPDLVELKVMKNGNMGGIVCYQGTYKNWENRIIFPAFPVQKGDFIILHFKPQNIPEEINETDKKDVSGGLDASPDAYDFWIKDGKGLSGNNGVLTIYRCSGGRMIDGVLYSNRTSESDEDYMGFGTRKVMERALELAASGGWVPDQAQIRPEDGINPDDSTATRSMCRDRKGTDTNTRYDWHIVPTRKSTFGEENCEEVWE